MIQEKTFVYSTNHYFESLPKSDLDGDWKVFAIKRLENCQMNMFTMTNKEKNETKFLIKEAPGSRKVSFIGNKLAKSIDLLAFVSKENLLLKYTC